MRKNRAAEAYRKDVHRFRWRAAALLALAGIIAWAAWLAPWNKRPHGIPVMIPNAPQTESRS